MANIEAWICQKFSTKSIEGQGSSNNIITFSVYLKCEFKSVNSDFNRQHVEPITVSIVWIH